MKAIFFITGHMAEKLRYFPKVLNLLKTHEIGYHSSAHSVHPTIFEFTDLENYEAAYNESLKRETSTIDPVSGEITGKGGIKLLEELFLPKKISSYRSPGFCFSPPHLEALASLGIKYDFSCDFSDVPVSHRGITFYPFPVFLDCTYALFEDKREFLNWFIFLCSVAIKGIVVLDFHPNYFVNQNWWDSIYYKGNPSRLFPSSAKRPEKITEMLRKFELLLKMLKALEKLGITEVTPELRESKITLNIKEIDVEKIFQHSVQWSRRFFAYEPRFLRLHLMEFLHGHTAVDMKSLEGKTI